MDTHTDDNGVNEYYELRQKIDIARELLDHAQRNAEKGYYDVAWDYLLDVSVLTDQRRTKYSGVTDTKYSKSL